MLQQRYSYFSDLKYCIYNKKKGERIKICNYILIKKSRIKGKKITDDVLYVFNDKIQFSKTEPN